MNNGMNQMEHDANRDQHGVGEDDLSELPDPLTLLQRLSLIRDKKRQILNSIDSLKDAGEEIDRDVLSKLVGAYDGFKDQETQFLQVLNKVMVIKYGSDSNVEVEQKMMQSAKEGADYEDLNGLEEQQVLLQRMKEQQATLANLRTVANGDGPGSSMKQPSLDTVENDSESGIDINPVGDTIGELQTQQDSLSKLRMRLESLQTLSNQASQITSNGAANFVSESSGEISNEVSDRPENESSNGQIEIPDFMRNKLVELGEKKSRMDQLLRQLHVLQEQEVDKPGDADVDESNLMSLRNLTSEINSLASDMGRGAGPADRSQVMEEQQPSMSLQNVPFMQKIQKTNTKPAPGTKHEQLENKFRELQDAQSKLSQLKGLLSTVEQQGDGAPAAEMQLVALLEEIEHDNEGSSDIVGDMPNLSEEMELDDSDLNDISVRMKSEYLQKLEEQQDAVQKLSAERERLFAIKNELMQAQQEAAGPPSINFDARVNGGLQSARQQQPLRTDRPQSLPPRPPTAPSRILKEQELNRSRRGITPTLTKVSPAQFWNPSVADTSDDEEISEMQSYSQHQQSSLSKSAQLPPSGHRGRTQSPNNRGSVSARILPGQGERRLAASYRKMPAQSPKQTSLHESTPEYQDNTRSMDQISEPDGAARSEIYENDIHSRRPRGTMTAAESLPGNLNRRHSREMSEVAPPLAHQYDQLQGHIDSIRNIFQNVAGDNATRRGASLPPRMVGGGAMSLQASYNSSNVMPSPDPMTQSLQQQQMMMTSLMTFQQQMQVQQMEMQRISQMCNQLAYNNALLTQQNSPHSPNSYTEFTQSQNSSYQQLNNDDLSRRSSNAHLNNLARPVMQQPQQQQMPNGPPALFNPMQHFDSRPLSSASLYNLIGPNPYLAFPFYPQQQQQGGVGPIGHTPAFMSGASPMHPYTPSVHPGIPPTNMMNLGGSMPAAPVSPKLANCDANNQQLTHSYPQALRDMPPSGGMSQRMNNMRQAEYPESPGSGVQHSFSNQSLNNQYPAGHPGANYRNQDRSLHGYNAAAAGSIVYANNTFPPAGSSADDGLTNQMVASGFQGSQSNRMRPTSNAEAGVTLTGHHYGQGEQYMKNDSPRCEKSMNNTVSASSSGRVGIPKLDLEENKNSNLKMQNCQVAAVVPEPVDSSRVNDFEWHDSDRVDKVKSDSPSFEESPLSMSAANLNFSVSGSHFESVREVIYSEVATLISQNENRPQFLLDLFHELQAVSSDYLRNRTVKAVKVLLNKYVDHDSDDDDDDDAGDVVAVLRQENDDEEDGSPEVRSMIGSGSPELIDDEPMFENEDAIGELEPLQLSSLEERERTPGRPWNMNHARLVSNISTDRSQNSGSKRELEQSSFGLGNNPISSRDKQHDYSEAASTASSLSTPEKEDCPIVAIVGDPDENPYFEESELSPAEHGNVEMNEPKPVVQESEDGCYRPNTLELREEDYETDKFNFTITGLLMSDGMETSDPDEQSPRNEKKVLFSPNKEKLPFPLDTQLSAEEMDKKVDVSGLEHQIQEIVDELIPFLRENVVQSCTPQMLAYLRKLILTLATEKCAPSTTMSEFFHRQLSSILDDTLAKFQGQTLDKCGEEIIADISEVVFNELAFFRMMQDIDSGRKSGRTPSSEQEPMNDIAVANQTAMGRDVVFGIDNLRSEVINAKVDEKVKSRSPRSMSISEDEDIVKKSDIKSVHTAVTGTLSLLDSKSTSGCLNGKLLIQSKETQPQNEDVELEVDEDILTGTEEINEVPLGLESEYTIDLSAEPHPSDQLALSCGFPLPSNRVSEKRVERLNLDMVLDSGGAMDMAISQPEDDECELGETYSGREFVKLKILSTSTTETTSGLSRSQKLDHWAQQDNESTLPGELSIGFVDN